MKEKIKKISDYIFYLGVIVAGYGLYKSYIATRGLPAGACPIEDNRPKLYLAIGLLLVSFLMSFINERWQDTRKEN